MKKAETNKKLFSSGGVFVDLFIGFLIAACVAGIVYRCFIYDPNKNLEAGESYMVYFEITDAHESYASYLEDTDTVYDSATGKRIGALAPHNDHAEGSAVAVLQDEQQEDAPLTVTGVFRSVPGLMEQGSLVIDGTYMLTPGQVLEIYTDTVAVYVRIISITEIAEQDFVE